MDWPDHDRPEAIVRSTLRRGHIHRTFGLLPDAPGRAWRRRVEGRFRRLHPTPGLPHRAALLRGSGPDPFAPAGRKPLAPVCRGTGRKHRCAALLGGTWPPIFCLFTICSTAGRTASMHRCGAWPRNGKSISFSLLSCCRSGDGGTLPPACSSPLWVGYALHLLVPGGLDAAAPWYLGLFALGMAAAVHTLAPGRNTLPWGTFCGALTAI